MRAKFLLLSSLLTGSLWAHEYEVGLTASAYSYQEPGIMALEGPQYRVFTSGRFFLGSGVHSIRADYSFAFASVDYESARTGKDDGEKQNTHDLRAFWQRAVGESGNHSFFVGLGYRRLSHDGRGTSSTGAAGYRRLSQYFYLPTGWESRISFSENWRIILYGELGLLLSGRQTSYLGDAGGGRQTINNSQGAGINFRAHTPVEFHGFRFGPFLDYWNVGQSEVTADPQNPGRGYVEPANNTLEYGARLSYFW